MIAWLILMPLRFGSSVSYTDRAVCREVIGLGWQSLPGLSEVLGREAAHSSLRLKRGEGRPWERLVPSSHTLCRDGGVQMALKPLSPWCCWVQGAMMLSK